MKKNLISALVLAAIAMFISAVTYAYVCDGGRYAITQGGKKRLSYACLDDGGTTNNVDILTTASLLSGFTVSGPVGYGSTVTFDAQAVFNALIEANAGIQLGAAVLGVGQGGVGLGFGSTITMGTFTSTESPTGKRTYGIRFGDTAGAPFMFGRRATNPATSGSFIRVKGTIVPNANNTYFLGQAGNAWNRGYFSQIYATGNSFFGLDGTPTNSQVVFGQNLDPVDLYITGTVNITPQTFSFWDGTTTGPSGKLASLSYNPTLGGILWDTTTFFIGTTMAFGETVGAYKGVFGCNSNPCFSNFTPFLFPDYGVEDSSLQVMVMGNQAPGESGSCWFKNNTLMCEGVDEDAYKTGILMRENLTSDVILRIGDNAANSAALVTTAAEIDPHSGTFGINDLNLLTGVSGGATFAITAPVSITGTISAGTVLVTNGIGSSNFVTGGTLAQVDGSTVELFIEDGSVKMFKDGSYIEYEGTPDAYETLVKFDDPLVDSDLYITGTPSGLDSSLVVHQGTHGVGAVYFTGACSDGDDVITGSINYEFDTNGSCTPSALNVCIDISSVGPLSADTCADAAVSAVNGHGGRIVDADNTYSAANMLLATLGIADASTLNETGANMLVSAPNFKGGKSRGRPVLHVMNFQIDTNDVIGLTPANGTAPCGAITTTGMSNIEALAWQAYDSGGFPVSTPNVTITGVATSSGLLCTIVDSGVGTSDLNAGDEIRFGAVTY